MCVSNQPNKRADSPTFCTPTYPQRFTDVQLQLRPSADLPSVCPKQSQIRVGVARKKVHFFVRYFNLSYKKKEPSCHRQLARCHKQSKNGQKNESKNGSLSGPKMSHVSKYGRPKVTLVHHVYRIAKVRVPTCSSKILTVKTHCIATI